MMRVGTLSWMERTGGKLAWRDRLTLMAQAVIARSRAKRRPSAGKSRRTPEVAAILPPDSALTREAVAVCQDASPAYLFNHCLRAYFWARLLDDGAQPYDDEATFTALLLHDLGLTERYRPRGSLEECFTAVGSRRAFELTKQHGWSDQRAEVAAEAITLHLNVVVGASHGREAQLVRVGSGADVAGLGIDVLPSDQIQSVVARYPRHNMKEQILSALTVEANDHPHCRAAFLINSLGFAKLIRATRYFSE